MERKNILILRACGVAGEAEECDNIKCQSKLYGLEVDDFCPKTNAELSEILFQGKQYNYIYLSSHGNSTQFGSRDGLIGFSWLDFGSMLCESMVMKEDCIVLLSCCRGGLNQVAYDLFYCCGKIAYVVGPRQSLYPHDMLIGFNILLYNLVHRGVDPIVACEKIKLGTDIRFVCFDKLETESDANYKMHISEYEREWIESINRAKEVANEPIIDPPKEIRAIIGRVITD